MQPPIVAASLRRRHKTRATGRKSSSAKGIRRLRIPGGRGRYGGWDRVLIQCRLTSGIRQAAWIESFRERIGLARGRKTGAGGAFAAAKLVREGFCGGTARGLWR